MAFGCFKNVWSVGEYITPEFESFVRSDASSESSRTFMIERFSLKNEHSAEMG